MLEHSYKEYRSKGFVLIKTLRYKKFSAAEGSYRERKNEPFSNRATGYAAIIPPELIIVDNDSYEEGNEFDSFVKALGYTPEPFAITPSGGEHYAFANPYPDKVCGKSTYNKVDIFAGYQSVIPIVGTKVKNKHGEVKSYEWAPGNITEEIIINPIPENKVHLFNLRDRVEGAKSFSSDMDPLDVEVEKAERNRLLPLEEVEAIIEALPPMMEYDDWLRVGMALYDRFMGSDEGKKLWHSYSIKSSEKYDADYTEKKWANGHLHGSNISYKSLPFIASEFSIKEYYNWVLSHIETLDDIESIDLYSNRAKLFSSMPDSEIETIAKALNAAYKRVKADMTGRQARTIKKAIKKGIPKSSGDKGDSAGIEVYRLVNKYIVKAGNKIIEGVTASMLKEVLASVGLRFDDADDMFNFKAGIPNISRYIQEPDYTQHEAYRIELVDTKDEKFPALVLKTNPIQQPEHDIDEAIVEEFFNGVWAGKLIDIIKMMALSIKTGETKLNRLMVVAPSNSGKTEIFTMLGFQKVTMQRLLLAMRAEKGVGKQVVDGIRRTGLLLIDEANKPLEAEIKDMDKYLHIDQFGADGGTQILRLHFTALTSTHFTATRNNSDELYNRFLQVELKASEMRHNVTEGPLFRADSDKYSRVVKAKMQELFIEYLTNHEGKEELSEIQERYRLPLNNDLEELLYEVSVDFIDTTKTQAREFGDIIKRQDSYFYKRKTDIRAYFDARLGEISGIDVGKYSDMLMSHFIRDHKGKTIKVDGKPVKYYEVSTTPFSGTYTEGENVAHMFDDLDIETF